MLATGKLLGSFAPFDAEHHNWIRVCATWIAGSPVPAAISQCRDGKRRASHTLPQQHRHAAVKAAADRTHQQMRPAAASARLELLSLGANRSDPHTLHHRGHRPCK